MDARPISDPAPRADDAPSTGDAPPADALVAFVDLWGDMATSWGINRTMAQIHALLFASAEPLDTDTIMERLAISRGNANTNLRALLDWNLVRKTSRDGSRKDFYVAEADVWTITATIIEERRRREIAPVRQALAELTARAPDTATPEGRVLHERLGQLAAFLDVFDGFATALLPLLTGRHADKVQRVVRYAARLRAARRR
jgi:DNA-binding transcriptional regulator GbsR (MarR family)